jgi:hypothetical protein
VRDNLGVSWFQATIITGIHIFSNFKKFSITTEIALFEGFDV